MDRPWVFPLSLKGTIILGHHLCHKCFSDQKKAKEKIKPLLTGKRQLLTNGMEKAEF